MIEKLDRRNLGIYSNGMLHIDNYIREDHKEIFKTMCGVTEPKTYELDNYQYNHTKSATIKLCKTCSKVYFNKYKEPFFSYISVLKLKGKLFI